MYGRESWTIKKTEHQRIDAFELWFWRRLLRVPWTARRSNQYILKEISPEYSLEGLMLKLKLQYFGHLIWRTDSLERPDAGKDWRQEEKRTTEVEMVGWHQWLNEHEFEQALRAGDGQGVLECCSPWGHKELDMTERWTESFSTKRGEAATWAERAKRSMKKESWILETQGKDGECYSVWRISSPKRWGIISPLLSVLFLLGKLGMKGWGRTFDSPSCQSLCWQLLFSPPAISFLPRLPPVQVNELRGSTPAAQRLPSHTRSTALGSICCSSGGGNRSPANREAQVRVFTWPKQG